MTHAPRPILAAIAAAAALAAGCGEKKDTTTGSASSTAPKTVTLKESEYRITPADATVGQAGTVKIEIRNTGKITHALAVEGPGGEHKSKTIPAGAAASLTAELKAGAYEIYCPIDGHKAKGMKGKLTVGGTGGGTTTTPEDKPKNDSGGGKGYY